MLPLQARVYIVVITSKEWFLIIQRSTIVYVTRCVAIRFRLCWRDSDDLFVWFGVKPRQRTEGEISRETGSGGGKEGPREDRENQLTEQGRRDQLAWYSCPENETVGRRRQEKMEDGQRRESTEIRKATAKTCWLTEARLTNTRRCQHCSWLL